MGFQKCPVCNGTGKQINTLSSSTYVQCRVCSGHGIIDELTGNPPNSLKNDINGGINGNGETQQEYFGK
jgi:DnaJ-class molecular chaperone